MLKDMWTDEDLGGLFKFLAVFFVVIGFVATYGGCREASTAAACRARGYSGSNVNYAGFGDGYCIRRVGLIDEVVPL